MMQQLATQSTQIAALPDNPVTLSPEPVTAEPSGRQFADVFSGQQAASHKEQAPRRPADASKMPANQQSAEQPAVKGRGAETAQSDSSVSNRQDIAKSAAAKPEASEKPGAEEAYTANNKDSKDVVEDTATLSKADNTSGTEQIEQSEWVESTLADDLESAVPAIELDAVNGETDYLALVDALRAFEQKWSGATQHQSPSPTGVTEEVNGESTAALMADAVKTAEQDAAKAQLETDLKALIAQIANSPEMNAEGDAEGNVEGDASVISIEQSEAILSDFMALVAQLKKQQANDSANDEGSELALPVEPKLGTTTIQADVGAVAENTENTENPDVLSPQPLSVAISLLSKIQALNSESATNSPAQSVQAADMVSEQLTALTLDAEQLTDAVIEVEESADPLLNQAALLLGLMTQQAGEQNSNASTTSSPGSKPAVAVEAATDAISNDVALQAMVAQASDDTLSQLAQVITDTAAAANPALSSAQQAQMKGMLINGLEEMRAQMQQGHQPAIDLTALVAQVSTEVQPEQQIIPQQLLQDAQHIAQLAANSVMSDQKETQLNELLHASRDLMTQETRQQQSENVKSLQQQAAMDKPVPLNQPQGQQQLAEKIRWMVNGRQSMAEIRLDPPEMGSMQIRLNISGDTASVSFIVQSQHAKDILADAMPRLKEMFSEQGIDLGESFVSQQQSGEAGEQQAGGKSGGGLNDALPEDTKMNETRVVRRANALIDDYV
ncbi:hypothetical protein FJ444_01230 [Aestuariibacter sp. GS-14]|uniref:flagellar hook-length control protein FliK n=1 Tax=Aestuariibacter sp. GS-14 TaxID=2590670 RepID=UPI001126960A|nr:flagellar hook-length control protein FliK [Aestuariibacter sp. GS-14]TPV61922.1 hypothetical protein FJ444_01230 [Aestuariibacter sp. GS-14]